MEREAGGEVEVEKIARRAVVARLGLNELGREAGGEVEVEKTARRALVARLGLNEMEREAEVK
jgi:hypothetical protein